MSLDLLTGEDAWHLTTLRKYAAQNGYHHKTVQRWWDRREVNGFPAPVARIRVYGGPPALGFRPDDITRWREAYAPKVGAAVHGNRSGGGFRPGNRFGRPAA